MTIIDYRAGWNAGAHSIRWSDGDCEATFEPRVDVTGAFVGFSAATDVTSLIEQTHSIHIRHTPAGSFADVYERSVLKSNLGAFVEGDVFKIRRVENEVTFWKNGSLVYTSLTSSTGRVFLTAALYLGGDRV